MGERQIDRRMLRLSMGAADAAPVFEVIYQFLLSVEQKQFASEGSQSGHPWAPLAASTLAAKSRQGLRPEILRATDALMNSLTQENGPAQLKVITPSQMHFGSLLPYGAMHQVPGPAANYPQRRPIDLTESNKRKIMKSIQLYLLRGKAPGIVI